LRGKVKRSKNGDSLESITIPVLIVGAGPVGLATALDLGWRGIECLIIDQVPDREAAINAHPRAAAVTPRTMEFCRRWNVAHDVHESGFPKDLTPNIVYCTSLDGPTITVQRFESINQRKPLPQSPELRQRCPQIWFDPILERGLTQFPAAQLRRPWKLESFHENGDCVSAHVTDLTDGSSVEIHADYLVACDGPTSSIREALGIAVLGKGVLSNSINVTLDIDDIASQHDKGIAERYMFLNEKGVWSSLTVVDGRRRWRFGFAGSVEDLDYRNFPVDEVIRKALGPHVRYKVVSITPWRRRDSVSERFRSGRVLLAGDAAHTIPPNLGMGMNTGVGDAVDLGWKLDAMLRGWGGPALLDSYEAERRPIAEEICNASTDAFRRWMTPTEDYGRLLEPGDAGHGARERVREYLARVLPDGWDSLGLQLGYRYEDSPIILADANAAVAPRERLSHYVQSSRPGGRAPHAWLRDGRTTIDLFGKGFVLLRFGAQPVDATALADAARLRGVPLSIIDIDEPDVAALYEKNLVLVRPDGHVAWRGDVLMPDPLAAIDRVRGA
jgi:2-polyprenyl-6-methoxyphenol hydroxylase-like FAD-dependent oxidoreductase